MGTVYATVFVSSYSKIEQYRGAVSNCFVQAVAAVLS